MEARFESWGRVQATMMTDEEVKDYLFRSLTPEEYEKVPVPSKEEIRAALKKASENLRKFARNRYGKRFGPAGLRYR